METPDRHDRRRRASLTTIPASVTTGPGVSPPSGLGGRHLRAFVRASRRPLSAMQPGTCTRRSMSGRIEPAPRDAILAHPTMAGGLRMLFRGVPAPPGDSRVRDRSMSAQGLESSGPNEETPRPPGVPGGMSLMPHRPPRSVPAAVILCAALAALSPAGQGESLAGEPSGVRETGRPNIVVIVLRRPGLLATSAATAARSARPNIDRLAADGLRFTRFYNASRCCPTRAALLTGLYPHQVGLARNGRDLSRDAATLAELLRAAGYQTAMAGKWHLSETALLGGNPDGPRAPRLAQPSGRARPPVRRRPHLSRQPRVRAALRPDLGRGRLLRPVLARRRDASRSGGCPRTTT